MASRPRNGLSLCAGGGGLDLGLMLAEPGFHTRAFVEWEEYPRSSIIAAQRAGYFAPAPIWDDLTTFDARPFAGAFDTLLAGYPCQPFSQAGQRRGADDERHLWPDVARVARELGDGLEWVFLENVAGHVTLGLETVLRDLWDMGFTPAAGLFTAAETGAPHERERVFIVAHARRAERRPGTGCGCIRDRDDTGWEEAAGRPSKSGNAGNGELANTTCARCEPARSGTGCECGGREQMPWARSGELGHAAGIGRGEGRAEPEFRLGRDAAASAGGTMADACGQRPQGREQPGSSIQRHRQAPHGSASECSRPWVHPPGPADMDGWRHTLAVAPHLAPAAGLADCLAWASDMAAAVEVQGKAQAEPALRRMADGLALRSRALRLLGNGVHPLAAAYAWRSLAAAHGLGPVDFDAARAGCGAASTLAI